jgi:hypothetical protein|nr:MAG TPA: hypothetical protein [Crassvirales sp.]
MKEFNVTIKERNVIISLPTSIDEVKKEYLENISKHIGVGDEHSLIALVYKVNLAYILNTKRKIKDSVSSIIPVFVRTGATENDFVNSLNTKDVLVVSASDISIGHHVGNIANTLSLGNVVNALNTNKELIKNSLIDQDNYYLVEFKIIPNCAIHGIIGIPEKEDNTYVKVVD